MIDPNGVKIMFNVNDMYDTKMPKGKKVEYKFDDYILVVKIKYPMVNPRRII